MVSGPTRNPARPSPPTHPRRARRSPTWPRPAGKTPSAPFRPRARPSTTARGPRCRARKAASFTSLSAIEMVKAVQEADIPPGVVNLITGPGGSAGEELAQHPLVDKVAFTGSTEVGRRIMQLASGTVKKVTLELGGKSANIVLDDADLDIAAAGVLWGTFFHNGQVC